jgi:hypothetical protein
MKVGHSWRRGAVKTKDEILAAGKTLDEIAGESYVFNLEGDLDEAVERDVSPSDTWAQAKRGEIAKSRVRARKSPPHKEESES